jgi:hypothetical protein
VFVERFESQTTDVGDGPVSKLTFLLVDETGQRMRLSAMAPSLSFASVPLGTQFWLDAYAIIQRANPFAYHRSMRFSLRTEENGPVVFASLQGTKEGGDVLLGVPLSFQSRCIATLASTGPIVPITSLRTSFQPEKRTSLSCSRRRWGSRASKRSFLASSRSSS